MEHIIVLISVLFSIVVLGKIVVSLAISLILKMYIRYYLISPSFSNLCFPLISVQMPSVLLMAALLNFPIVCVNSPSSFSLPY